MHHIAALGPGAANALHALRKAAHKQWHEQKASKELDEVSLRLWQPIQKALRRDDDHTQRAVSAAVVIQVLVQEDSHGCKIGQKLAR